MSGLRLSLRPLMACIPFETKAQGYRSVFEPQAQYVESPPSGIRERFDMQIRRAKTHLIVDSEVELSCEKGLNF